MKAVLSFFVVFLFIQGSLSFFYGANVNLPQTKTLSTTLNKCYSTADIIEQKLCQINKKALKFSQPNYQTFANYLTDIQYIFQSTKEFYTYFLNCLSDQSPTTADVTIRNLRVLVYQLNNYVITGFANNFNQSALAFGATFDCNYQQSINQLSTLLVGQFTKVATSLNQLVQSFAAIAASGSAITPTSLNATLNSDPFNNLVAGLNDACTGQTTFSNTLDTLWTTISSLESITAAVDAAGAGSNGMISQAQFFLDIANQAAKKTFSDRIASYTYTIDVSMAQFVALAGKLFVGDTDVIAYRQILETYVGTLRLFLSNVNNAFALMTTNNMGALTTTVNALSRIVNALEEAIKVNLQNIVASTCQIGSCFTTNTPFVAGIAADLGFNSSQCVVAQTTVSTQTASLLSFIVEDVVIEALGVIDRMCSCAVAGDPTTVRRSKLCMEKITNDLILPVNGTLALQTQYLQNEFIGVQAALATALGKLNSCIQTAMSNFGAAFGTFNSRLSVCRVG